MMMAGISPLSIHSRGITNQSSVAGILSSCALGVDCTRLQRVPYSRLSRGGFNPENNFKFRSKGQGQLPAAVSFLQKQIGPTVVSGASWISRGSIQSKLNTHSVNPQHSVAEIGFTLLYASPTISPVSATKAALAAAKVRGVKLGGSKLSTARKLAVAAIKNTADRHAANVLPVIQEVHKAGAATLRDIAEALNARGVSTPRGGQWYAASVRNVLARA
jgi:hypothetical protein